jgi:predicted cobalt transporter CbtA
MTTQIGPPRTPEAPGAADDPLPTTFTERHLVAATILLVAFLVVVGVLSGSFIGRLVAFLVATALGQVNSGG